MLWWLINLIWIATRFLTALRWVKRGRNLQGSVRKGKKLLPFLNETNYTNAYAITAFSLPIRFEIHLQSVIAYRNWPEILSFLSTIGHEGGDCWRPSRNYLCNQLSWRLRRKGHGVEWKKCCDCALHAAAIVEGINILWDCWEIFSCRLKKYLNNCKVRRGVGFLIVKLCVKRVLVWWLDLEEFLCSRRSAFGRLRSVVNVLKKTRKFSKDW